jgi:ribonuclease G
MTVEILVNVTPRESRAAFVENGVLQETYIERTNRLGITSNIYKARVSRVLPGMQAAFMEIGLERTAFLHVSDIARRDDVSAALADPKTVDIRSVMTEGDELLVQVLKDPLGTKGARLTTFITLPSRFLVYMPHGTGVGISARIEDDAERARLRELVESFITADRRGGYIVRTVAEGVSADALRADWLFLGRLWAVVGANGFRAPAGTLVHEDLPLPLRVLRDLLGQHVDRVLVDALAARERMVTFARTFMPESEAKIELYTGNRPIFDLYAVEDEIKKALDRKVPLKSGGYLVIDQTESMTTVDVNTGAFVGHRNLEDTIFRTNLEAAVAIARQLRLRNLGGIIIIDFIDMEDDDHRQQVLQALSKSLAADHARTSISSVSPLGLVEMTRKRTRESLEHLLCRPCPTCEGRRYVKTAETVVYEIFRELVRQASQFEVQGLMVLAHQDVIELLLDEESVALGELEVVVGKPIRLQTESLYAHDQYDVVLV